MKNTISIKYRFLTALFLAQGLNLLSKGKRYGFTYERAKETFGARLSFLSSRLLREKLIEVQNLGFGKEYKLSYLGKNALLERYPNLNFARFSASKDLPGNLLLVSFNIPENRRRLRDKLRYSLNHLKFGPLHKSLYLTPHLGYKETQRTLSSLGVLDDCLILPLRLEDFEKVDDFLSKIALFWNLRPIAENYERSLALWQVTAKVSDFLERFIDGFVEDPFLPGALLPKNWPLSKALEVLGSILGPKP